MPDTLAALADDSLDMGQCYGGPHAFIADIAAGEPGAVALGEPIDARPLGSARPSPT